jgi:peptidoglycan hydrolase CwlO-like protein
MRSQGLMIAVSVFRSLTCLTMWLPHHFEILLQAKILALDKQSHQQELTNKDAEIKRRKDTLTTLSKDISSKDTIISNLKTQINEKDAIVLGTKNETHSSKSFQEKIRKAKRKVKAMLRILRSTSKKLDPVVQ